MRLGAVLGVVALSVVLQAALARYTVGGIWAFDLVLVGVTYAALLHGPAAGMFAGTLGGLLQDLLTAGIVGVGGLAKTVVGYLTGVIGAQFVLARPQVRAGIVALATVVHRMLVDVIVATIAQEWLGFRWTAMLVETLINSVAALVAFQVTEALPGAVERRRAGRRSSLSRRQW
jgi:rod shape-determining protein MreD